MPSSRQPVSTAVARVRRIAAALVAAVLFGAFGAAFEAARAEEYKLGPQDKVRLRVYEWRAARGEVFEWAAFNGEFVIGAGGSLELPFLGTTPAQGLTPAELGRHVSERLQAKVGLAERPNASIEVTEYRPVFITGKVEKPGEYPYRPGLTVLQAFALAGGIQRTAEPGLVRLERETISQRGELQLLALERQRLIARRARLTAEAAGAEKIDYPAEISGPAEALALLRAQEDALFLMRRDSLRQQVKALGDLKVYLLKELESLDAQMKTGQRQLALYQKELRGVSSLVERGLAAAPRELALERSLAEMEGGMLRTQSAMMRAQQEANRTDLTILELQSKRRTEVADELQKTQARLDDVVNRSDTVRLLLNEIEVVAPVLVADRARMESLAKPVFTLVRPVGNAVQEIDATETARIEPGDVLRVQLPSLGGRDPGISPVGSVALPIGQAEAVLQRGTTTVRR
jgi:protein involved in polysaccharide export with SLBB domain